MLLELNQMGGAQSPQLPLQPPLVNGAQLKN
jgi:hypothetical protein